MAVSKFANTIGDAMRRAVDRAESTIIDKRVARKAQYARDRLLRKLATNPECNLAPEWRTEVDRLNNIIKKHGLKP